MWRNPSSRDRTVASLSRWASVWSNVCYDGRWIDMLLLGRLDEESKKRTSTRMVLGVRRKRKEGNDRGYRKEDFLPRVFPGSTSMMARDITDVLLTCRTHAHRGWCIPTVIVIDSRSLGQWGWETGLALRYDSQSFSLSYRPRELALSLSLFSFALSFYFFSFLFKFVLSSYLLFHIRERHCLTVLVA